MSNAITFLFKDIFADYTSFKNFLTTEGITISATDEPIYQYCFKLLFNRYHNSNIRYTTKDDFKGEFYIVCADELSRYIRRYKIIQSALGITDDDIVELQRLVQNYANNPNDEVSSPLEPLSYISNQTFQANLSNKLDAYVKAIEDMPSMYNEDFLYKFKELFMNIIPKQIIIYSNEEDE